MQKCAQICWVLCFANTELQKSPDIQVIEILVCSKRKKIGFVQIDLVAP